MTVELYIYSVVAIFLPKNFCVTIIESIPFVAKNAWLLADYDKLRIEKMRSIQQIQVNILDDMLQLSQRKS